MAKTLAGFLAISIAVLLFSGCGDGNSSSTPTTESTSTITTVPVNFVTQFGVIRRPVMEESERIGELPEVKGNQAATPQKVQEIWTPLGDLMVKQAADLLAAQWPEDVGPEMQEFAKLQMEWGRFYKGAAMYSMSEIRDNLLTYSSESSSLQAVIYSKLGVKQVKPPG
jgi:hypothetical protein